MASAVTSIYNNIISAASAGFAPTNSADVSAIASAYQVVSATATQLYAGTAYVTSVNEAPISASRAGNAANASLANSAYYDGTGRFISALPDSATVSAIASSYAESAASGKLDSTASSSFYPSDNPSGFISSVDLSDYATTAYVDSSVSSKLDATASSQFLTAVPSDYATTAYVDSSVSSKLDATASSQFLTSTAGLVGTGDLTAYAYESSNSAKLDTTAFSTVSSNFLTSIPSDYATTAYVDSSISGFAYESAVSAWTAKQDSLTFGYNTANQISSIDGSALAGGGGGLVTSLQYYTSGSTSTASGTANGFARAGNSTGSINYYTLDFGEHDPSCITAIQYSQILITADKNADFMTALPLVSSDLSAFTVYKSVADTAEFSSVPDSAKSYVGRLSTITSDLGTAVRYNLTSNNFSSIKTGEENVLVLAYEYLLDHWGTLSVTGTTGSFGFRYGSSSGYSAVSGVNELGIYVDTSNCYPTSNPSGFISSVDLSNYATTAYVDSSVSSKLDATASSQFITSTAGLATTADISGFAYESAVSGWTAKQDKLTFGYDGSNNISSIDGSSLAGGSVVFDGTSNKVSSIDGSAIQAQVLSSNKITIGISSDPGMFLSGTQGTAYYKANEMIINRSGYGEQIKFNLGSAGSQVYGSASGQRGAFISMSNDYHSAFLGAYSGGNGMLVLDGVSAGSGEIQTWNDAYDTVHSNSATWGGGGGIDSAACSAIASSYAESAVSSVSGNYYTTANESGYALSSDVSATVDLVGTQSANWGGSALALSAGPGVKLEKVGNTLIASTDETVLFSGSSYGVSFTETLSENITNFEYLGISISNAKNRASYTVYPVSEYPTNNMSVPTLFNKDASYAKGIGLHGMTIVFNKTSADSITCGCWLFNFNDTVGNSDSVYLTKIVGINRTAEA